MTVLLPAKANTSLLFNLTNTTKMFQPINTSMYIHSVLNRKNTNHLALLTCLALIPPLFTALDLAIHLFQCMLLITMSSVSFLVWVVLLIPTKNMLFFFQICKTTIDCIIKNFIFKVRLRCSSIFFLRISIDHYR